MVTLVRVVMTGVMVVGPWLTGVLLVSGVGGDAVTSRVAGPSQSRADHGRPMPT
jgi:hypothetical protein